MEKRRKGEGENEEMGENLKCRKAESQLKDGRRKIEDGEIGTRNAEHGIRRQCK
jgi:hypothetical protein